MNVNLIDRLVKYKDLIPSTKPFVESKLEGHKDRSVYSIIGPGVTEELKGISVTEAHGFNLGGVDTAPDNGSSLHSHTTAEVFLIHKGPWKFFWGVNGEDGEVILNKGDVVSFPTNMFRGFNNVGSERSVMYTILGRDDPGVITWSPDVLKKAKNTGMILLNDNSIVDTTLEKIPENKSILAPLNDEEVITFDKYKPEDIEKCIIRYQDLQSNNISGTDENFISYIENFYIDNKTFKPMISHNELGFTFGAVFGKKFSLKNFYSLDTHEIYIPLEGSWKVYCEDQEIVINPMDTFSVSVKSKRRFENLDDNGFMYIVREKID